MKISTVVYVALASASAVMSHEADYYINNARKAGLPDKPCNNLWNPVLTTFRNLAQQRYLDLQTCNKNLATCNANLAAYKTDLATCKRELEESRADLAAAQANAAKKNTGATRITITKTCTTTIRETPKTITIIKTVVGGDDSDPYAGGYRRARRN
ncbi:hypothetical protein TWF481_006575 [Arthrobotrys musiformis]|uniref:Uncharacterized protein n=1 Tax=Arthrobotrys musiformis TaxID=47236 RepID=A0AAV9WAU9_9PEZI